MPNLTDTSTPASSPEAIASSASTVKNFLFGWAETWSQLSAIGQILSAICAALMLVSIYFLLRQFRAEKNAIETQTSWSIYQVGIEIQKCLLEYPHLRKYLHNNATDVRQLSDDNRSRLTCLLEMTADHWENIYLTDTSVNIDTKTVWTKYMWGMYNTSPMLREFLQQEQEGYRYHPKFIAFLRAGEGWEKTNLTDFNSRYQKIG